MKFVILDGFLMNHDDVGLAVGSHEQIWYPSTDPAEAAARIGDAYGVLVNRCEITRETIFACPNLRYIGTLGTGYNMIDLAAAAERGITVCNTPGYSTSAVAQHTIALLLDIVCAIPPHDRLVRAGGWTKDNAKALVAQPMRELAGKTMGVFGAGAIGGAVARIAAALGMEAVCYRRTPDLGDGLRYVEADELIARSDVISIHAPLTPETKGYFDAQTLSRMRDGAILLNTARGAIVDEAAVARALESGKLWAYGADVLAQEPPEPDHPLLGHPKALITPHVAWQPRETRERGLRMAAENILAFVAGAPQNTVRL